MGRVTVAGIAAYPVKSLGGGPRPHALVEKWGLQGDRRFMVVDALGRFLSQRECPVMALVQAALTQDGLVLSGRGVASLTVPAARGALRQVRIWRDTVMARDAGDEAAAWLGRALGLPCRLVHLEDAPSRRIKAAYAADASECVSFADGFPLLMVSESSLADLNGRLRKPVSLQRFRPNLVVTGAAPWAEDTWRRIRIGGAVFRVAKPCDRCIITTFDPLTGLQPDGNEPLTTLAGFRRDASGGVMFGQNLVPKQCGAVRVGDTVEVLESGASNVVAVSRTVQADP